jgi:hypothetical protein
MRELSRRVSEELFSAQLSSSAFPPIYSPNELGHYYGCCAQLAAQKYCKESNWVTRMIVVSYVRKCRGEM